MDTQENGGKKEINTTCAVAIHGKFSEAADFVVAGVCLNGLRIAKRWIVMNRNRTDGIILLVQWGLSSLISNKDFPISARRKIYALRSNPCR